MKLGNKGILILVVLVAVLGVVGVIVMQKEGPRSSDLTGAIGAAERYRADETLTTEDVVLQDVDVQAFMQTDVFHELVTDPETVKILSSEEFQRPGADALVADLSEK